MYIQLQKITTYNQKLKLIFDLWPCWQKYFIRVNYHQGLISAIV